MEKLSQKSIKKGFNFKSFFKEWGLIFFILIIIAIASAKRTAFLSGSNLINILRSYSTIGIAALGMAYTVIAGGMDLSISSTVSLSAVLTMLVINATTVDRVSLDYASFVVLLIGIVVGATVGCISGGILAAVNGRMGESFIITYAIQIIVAAVANAVVNGQLAGCRPMDGSSNTYRTPVVRLRTARASCIRWRSPVESVDAERSSVR